MKKFIMLVVVLMALITLHSSPALAFGLWGGADMFVPKGSTVPPLTASMIAAPRATAYTKQIDFTTGSFTEATFASATGRSVVTANGKTRIGWSSANTAQYNGVKITGDWDFSASNMFALDMGETIGNDLLTYVDIYLCFDTGTAFTNYARITPINPMIRGAMPLLKSSFAITGSANWASVKRIEIRYYKSVINSLATSTSSLDLYAFYSHVIPPKSKVVLSFDDNHDTQYSEVFAYMRPKGMKGTLFVNGNSAGLAGKMSIAQTREMYISGWDVANHTIDHTRISQHVGATRVGNTVTGTTFDDHGLAPGNTITLTGGEGAEYQGTYVVDTTPTSKTFTYTIIGAPSTPDTVGPPALALRLDSVLYLPKITQQSEWQRTNAFRRYPQIFAYPQGFMDIYSAGVLSDNGFLAARTTGNYATPLTVGEIPTLLGVQDPMMIPTYTLTNTTTAASVLASLDSAITRGSAFNIYGHKVLASPGADTLAMSTAEFRLLIDGIETRRSNGQLDVITFGEWLAGK